MTTFQLSRGISTTTHLALTTDSLYFTAAAVGPQIKICNLDTPLYWIAQKSIQINIRKPLLLEKNVNTISHVTNIPNTKTRVSIKNVFLKKKITKLITIFNWMRANKNGTQFLGLKVGSWIIYQHPKNWMIIVQEHLKEYQFHDSITFADNVSQ